MTVRRMKLGQTYRTLAGGEFTVLELCDQNRGYETVRCSDTSENAPDGIHRYNRTTHDQCNGRVTGTDHDYTDARNADRRDLGWATKDGSCETCGAKYKTGHRLEACVLD